MAESISSFNLDFSSRESISMFELLELLNLCKIRSISLSVISFFKFSLATLSFLYFVIKIENLFSNSGFRAYYFLISAFKSFSNLEIKFSIVLFIILSSKVLLSSCRINLKAYATLSFPILSPSYIL